MMLLKTNQIETYRRGNSSLHLVAYRWCSEQLCAVSVFDPGWLGEHRVLLQQLSRSVPASAVADPGNNSLGMFLWESHEGGGEPGRVLWSACC